MKIKTNTGNFFIAAWKPSWHFSQKFAFFELLTYNFNVALIRTLSLLRAPMFALEYENKTNTIKYIKQVVFDQHQPNYRQACGTKTIARQSIKLNFS